MWTTGKTKAGFYMGHFHTFHALRFDLPLAKVSLWEQSRKVICGYLSGV